MAVLRSTIIHVHNVAVHRRIYGCSVCTISRQPECMSFDVWSVYIASYRSVAIILFKQSQTNIVYHVTC
jgi:hypothetical protein